MKNLVGKLVRIMRYPIKGFCGEDVDPAMSWRPYIKPHKELLIITAGIGITVAISIIARLKMITTHQKSI